MPLQHGPDSFHLIDVLKSSSINSPTLFLFIKVVFAVLLYFRISLSISTKKKKKKGILGFRLGLCVCPVMWSCLTLCDPMNDSLPGSSVHGTFQARILQQVAIFYSRGSSRPRGQTRMSCTGRWILYHCATWEAVASIEVFGEEMTS